LRSIPFLRLSFATHLSFPGGIAAASFVVAAAVGFAWDRELARCHTFRFFRPSFISTYNFATYFSSSSAGSESTRPRLRGTLIYNDNAEKFRSHAHSWIPRVGTTKTIFRDGKKKRETIQSGYWSLIPSKTSGKTIPHRGLKEAKHNRLDNVYNHGQQLLRAGEAIGAVEMDASDAHAALW
jgi:hypothetical protein